MSRYPINLPNDLKREAEEYAQHWKMSVPEIASDYGLGRYAG